MAEVEELGGMAKAIENGLPKLRIEEAAARKQARIDSGVDRIVGVNIFPPEDEQDLDTLEVDNDAVRRQQTAQLERTKRARNAEQVQQTLAEVTRRAREGGNLLEAAVEAARARATLGEISAAMEDVFGRYRANTATVRGAYRQEIAQNETFARARALADRFAAVEGRRPRIMIAKLGQDGHDRGAKVIATSFADIGFDVDVGPLFQTPEEAARQATENDVHLLGISSLAAGHKTLVPRALAELQALGREDILVIVGGVIPPKDYDFLFDAGVAGVFGPGTVVAEAAAEILGLMLGE